MTGPPLHLALRLAPLLALLLAGCDSGPSDIRDAQEPMKLVVGGGVAGVADCVVKFEQGYGFGLIGAHYPPIRRDYGDEIRVEQKMSDKSTLTLVKLDQLSQYTTSAEVWISPDLLTQSATSAEQWIGKVVGEPSTPADRVWADYANAIHACAGR